MMKVNLFIYVDGISRKLELFKDEQISVTSLVKDLSDINKIYTDYSKTFTIPASKKNNDILSHWYENAVEDGFDQRIKAKGYIEIDTILFREGLWQLEAASVKENKIQSYSITFFGNLKTFVDDIGEAKIQSLDLDFLDIDFTNTSVADRVEGLLPNEAVQFPLIANTDFWAFSQIPPNTANNILESGTIKFNNLPPAVSIEKIFEAIQTDYNVIFSGDFLNSQNFKRLYLYFKNEEEYFPTLKTKRLSFSTFSETGSTPITFTPSDNFFIYNSQGVDAFNSELVLNITPSIADQPYTIFINRTNAGVPLFRYDVPVASGTSATDILGESIPAQFNNQAAGTYFIEITSPVEMDFSGTIVYSGQTLAGSPLAATITIPSQSLANKLNLNALAPDMRIVDLITGIVKMFNLVIIPIGENQYRFETLEKYYQLGSTKDLTQYAETSNKIERIKVYNKVEFKYQKSGTIINTRFRDTLGRDYADLDAEFNGDGGEFLVELPFETLLFLNMVSTNPFSPVVTNIEMGYNITPDVKPYKNKPIILYKDKVKTSSFFTVADRLVSTFLAFGNQTQIGALVFSLNFGIENRVDNNQPIFNSLFQTYYLDYLNNIYDKRARKIKIKMRLPLSVLTNLELNDKIIIRDKRYLINSFTNELTTGETTFELVQDFRTLVLFSKSVELFTTAAETLVLDAEELDDDAIISITTQTFSTMVYNSAKNEIIITVTENTGKDARIDVYEIISNGVKQVFYVIQEGAI
jgi:hypothetical protein